MTMLHGVVHGRTIELQEEPGLPEGQAVAITIQRIEPTPTSAMPKEIPPVELWMDRLIFDSAVLAGERIVKGTRLSAEALVTELGLGQSDNDLFRAYPELTKEDLDALRYYARVPVGIRKTFGAWAEDAEELDKYLAWTRERRKLKRREIAP